MARAKSSILALIWYGAQPDDAIAVTPLSPFGREVAGLLPVIRTVSVQTCTSPPSLPKVSEHTTSKQKMDEFSMVYYNNLLRWGWGRVASESGTEWGYLSVSSDESEVATSQACVLLCLLCTFCRTYMHLLDIFVRCRSNSNTCGQKLIAMLPKCVWFSSAAPSLTSSLPLLHNSLLPIFGLIVAFNEHSGLLEQPALQVTMAMAQEGEGQGVDSSCDKDCPPVLKL